MQTINNKTLTVRTKDTENIYVLNYKIHQNIRIQLIYIQLFPSIITKLPLLPLPLYQEKPRKSSTKNKNQT